MFQTDYIEIEPDKAYYDNFYNTFVNVYNENKEFLHASTVSQLTHIEENAPFIYSNNNNAKYIILIGNTSITPLKDYYCYYIKQEDTDTLNDRLQNQYATKNEIEELSYIKNIIQKSEAVSNKHEKSYTVRHNIYYELDSTYDTPLESANIDTYEITDFVPNELIAYKAVNFSSIGNTKVLFVLKDGTISNTSTYGTALASTIGVDYGYYGLISIVSEDVAKIIFTVNNTFSYDNMSIFNPVIENTSALYKIVNTNAITNEDLPIKPNTYNFIQSEKYFLNHYPTRSSNNLVVRSGPTIISSYMVPIIKDKVYEINVGNAASMSVNVVVFNTDCTIYSSTKVNDGNVEYTAPISGYIVLLCNTTGNIDNYTDTFYVKCPPELDLTQLGNSSSSGSTFEGLSYQDSLKAVFQNKKWASLGDSITAREMWQPYVVDFLGLTHYNCGTGSTCLSGTGSTAFWQDARLNKVKENDPDIVTIFGGANDLVQNPVIGTKEDIATKTTDTFIGAYAYIIENLLTWKANLKVFIISTTWAHRDGKMYSDTVTYGEFADACELVANYYGLPYIDLYHNARYNMFTMDSNHIYGTDTIHPNADGGKIIANLVISKFIECMFPYYI